MRKVYHTLQKLKDQEKKERHRRFAEAQNVLVDLENGLVSAQENLNRERKSRKETIGAHIVSEHLNMQRHMNIQKLELDIKKQHEVVERLREEMKLAQIECKVMEKVIEGLEEKEKIEYNRKLETINDEMAVMGWSRKNEV